MSKFLHLVVFLLASFGVPSLLLAADPFPPEGTAPIAPKNADGPFEMVWITPRVRPHNFFGDLRFSDDGKRLLLAQEGQAQVWDTTTWKPVGPRIEYGNWIQSVEMDSAGKRLLVMRDLVIEKPVPGGTTFSYEDVEWRLWDVESGRAASEPVQMNVKRKGPDGGMVPSAGFTVLSPDGRLVATTHDGKMMRLISAENDGKEQVFKFDNWVDHIWFLPDSATLVITDGNGIAHMVEIKTGKIRSTEHSYDRVAGFAEGRVLVNWFFGFTVRDLKTEKVLVSFDDYRKYDVGDMLLSRDGKRVAVEIALRETEVWDVDSGKRVAVLETNGPRALDPKGTVLISESYKVLKNRDVVYAPAIWDTQTGKKVRDFDDYISDVTFNPDGNLLAVRQGRVIRVIHVDPKKKGAERWRVEKAVEEKK